MDENTVGTAAADDGERKQRDDLAERDPALGLVAGEVGMELLGGILEDGVQGASVVPRRAEIVQGRVVVVEGQEGAGAEDLVPQNIPPAHEPGKLVRRNDLLDLLAVLPEVRQEVAYGVDGGVDLREDDVAEGSVALGECELGGGRERAEGGAGGAEEPVIDRLVAQGGPHLLRGGDGPAGL
eukprot:CAMPEP_0196660532 /NCGR_PEP_ID=MMETSP1086-20130531/40201_1 /TAXON_ID=77921 /ORGANISM="Cyanoptyche  gloeocystis , Strain SAG4.97" /LENGTH=181 /DNA_ID=CAMNT_0041994987 /DNA_START=58 /DNA_END=603 /DNA_ORIENTATION=-